MTVDLHRLTKGENKMAWIAPKLDYVNNYVPTPTDFNRMEGNSDYIYNTGIKPDTDAAWNLGRGELGYNPNFGNDVFSISHYGQQNGTSYGLVLTTNSTLLNAPSGGTTSILIGNNPISTFDDNEVIVNRPLNVNADTDSITSLGRGRLGFITGRSDEFHISHFDRFTATGYALRQLASGATILNAETGQLVSVHVGNVSVSTFGLTSVTMHEDTDSTTSLGRGKMGFITGRSDEFHIGHIDKFTSTGYGLRILASGATLLNAETGQLVSIRTGDSTVATFGSASVILNQPLTVGTANVTTANITGEINPTTTPTESTISRTTAGATLIPRGQFQILLQAVAPSGSEGVDVSIERFIDGEWFTIQLLESAANLTRREVVNGLQDSTGADLRMVYSGIPSGGTITLSVILRKY
jgi:hypothetical protein